MKLELTPDEIRNLIAFGNRADMKGSEADLWVGLKTRILKQVQEQESSAKKEAAGLEVVGSTD